METPHVILRLPDGTTATVPPGGIVGRHPTAACRISDPGVGEAHALVSLRGRELRLLALRGRLAVDGRAADDLVLVPGLSIALADGVAIVVTTVVLPGEVLALRFGDGPSVELTAPMYSVTGGGLVPRYTSDASARVWHDDGGWWIQVGAEPREGVRAGSVWSIDGVALSAVHVAPNDGPSTVNPPRRDPLTIVVRTTSVHLLREGRDPVVVDGIPARALTELALIGAPVGWEVVAREVWPRGPDRENWDRTLRRLRATLRAGGIRENLVRSDGHGNVELLLLPGDELIDQA